MPNEYSQLCGKTVAPCVTGSSFSFEPGYRAAFVAMLFRSLGSLVPALEHRRGLLAREAGHTESIPGRLLLRRGAPLGDDRLVKTKPRLLKWLVLGCIKADFNLQVNARSKALDESYNMYMRLLGTFLCTSPNSTIQHIFVTNYDDFFTNVQTTSSICFCNVRADLC